MLKKTGNQKNIPRILFILILFFILPVLTFAQNISLTSELENNSIWLGDSVVLTITLNGSEQAFEPKLLIPGVRIRSNGGSKRSSESVMNINGRVTREVNLSYVFSFILTPEKAGTVTVPPVQVEVEGKTFRTVEVSLEVKAPEFSDDYHLILKPDTEKSYISEEIGLNLIFLFNSSIQELDIRIPELEDFSYKQAGFQSGKEQYTININGRPFTFYRADQSYRGTRYAGVGTSLLIKSNTPGTKDLSGSIAVFDAVTGSERVRDFFGRVQEQAVYSRIVVPAEPVSLNIIPFPEDNKPVNFTGLSGNISAVVTAEPTEVRVGDPITLKIKLHGLNNPEIELPPLKKLLGDDFDIPDTKSYDKITGGTREITQTIRVRSSETKEIPSIVLSYFNTESEKYMKITTPPIPLKVEETTVLTSQDLEGAEDGENSSSGKNLVGKTREGIYYNYTGDKVLERKEPLVSSLSRSPAIWIMIIFPPVIYLVVMLSTSLFPRLRDRIIRNRNMKASYRSMVRKIKFIHEKDPKEYLRQCNREIDSFIKRYNIDCSNTQLSKKMEDLDNYLYGKNCGLPENSREIIEDILKTIEEEKLV